jgi:O-antigen ligase
MTSGSTPKNSRQGGHNSLAGKTSLIETPATGTRISGPAALQLEGMVPSSQSGPARAQLVKLLVLVAFALCMSALEEVFYTRVGDELNPLVGVMKLSLLGVAFAILLLCRGRRHHWAVAGPFCLLMAWAVVCWIVSGAEMLPARNLVSSFGGILVLAALCAAVEYVGGIGGMVRLLVWALVLTALTSVFLGIVGLQAMPGQLASPTQLEWFHGIGLPSYAEAGCAALIAWVLAQHLSGPGVRLEAAMLLLLIIPALTFLRAYLIGIVISIMLAAFVAVWHRFRKTEQAVQTYALGYKRLLLLVTVILVLASAIFLLKTSTREEGEELSGREIIWPIEIASVIQNPVFGLGPFGDIELLRFKEDLPQVGSAHSDYLAVAVCYGLPGLFLFVAALFTIWRRVLRYRAVSLQERSCRYAAMFSLAGLSTTIIAENVIRDPRLFSLHLLFPALCLSAAALHQEKAAR